jgi:hypothetical protein
MTGSSTNTTEDSARFMALLISAIAIEMQDIMRAENTDLGTFTGRKRELTIGRQAGEVNIRRNRAGLRNTNRRSEE